jgi:glycosyltransferase involved in cell wall biosynthesis
MKPLTLSIVIPVYNEENHLRPCLEAIAAQTVKPHEVIVVDNNSTDKTVEIARSFSFVTVLHEKRQHQTFAQATGFNHASSSIVGRIDADTWIPPHWVEKVLAEFEKHPDTLAITGDGIPYDVPLRHLGSFVFRLYHERISSLFAGHPMIWGANCALRATTWHQIKDKMVYRPDIWEDYEMAFCIAPLGTVRFVKSLKVRCSFRVAHKSFMYMLEYQLRAIRTFNLYRSKWRTALFAVVWLTMLWVFPFTLMDRLLLWRKSRAYCASLEV